MKAIKKSICIVLALIMLMSCTVFTASAAEHPFTDVSKNAWYAKYVQYVYDRGLMSGTTATTFSPQSQMDRAMLVSVLYRMDGSKNADGSTPFTDIRTQGYYYSALVWAYQNSIISGTSKTQFSPHVAITREMMVAIFFRYSQYLNQPVSKLSGLASYRDADSISPYAKTAFQWAVANDIVSGDTPTTLSPKKTATRAECATVLERFSKWLQDRIPSFDETVTPPEDHTHSYLGYYYMPPTCTDEGYDYKKCSCGAIEKTATYNAYGHYHTLSSEQDGKLTYSCIRCDDSYQEAIETRYDQSLVPPTVERASADKYYMSVNCYADFERDSGYGYQCLVSDTDTFTDSILETKADYQWNNLGYAKLSYFGYYSPGTYYYKVRAYKEEDGVFVYGPWSEVKTMECVDFDTKSNGQAAYTYEVYFIDNLTTNVYTNSSRAIYIKTQNPELTSINLVANGKSILGNIQQWGGGQYYDDIEYLSISDYDEPLHKVEGGYIGMLSIDEAGPLTVEIHEASAQGYVVAKTFDLNVLDYVEERNKWIDNVITTQTDSSMNPKQKMDAIARYLDDGRFSYLTNVDGTLVTLAAEPNGPWFLSMRWDSATSPAMLEVFAKRIGGFEEIHNCFSDYPRGTEEWYIYHAMTYVVYNGEKTYYVVCPSTSTGEVGAVNKIDLSDTSKLIRVS